MDIFLIIFGALLLLALMIITAIHPEHSKLSDYELKRRAEKGDGLAIEKLRRERLLDKFEALQNVKISVLLVLITAILIAVLNWFFGIIAALFIALTYELVASSGLVHGPTQRIYERYEAAILNLIEKYSNILRVFGAKSSELITHLHSKEELQNVISRASFLSSSDKKALIANINFTTQNASDIMQPKSEIESIDQNETLGPLVLDQLHKTGQASFPVTSGSIDKIVGILSIEDMVSLKDKKSHKVAAVMNSSVHRVNQQQPAEEILADFLQQPSRLFIVVDDKNKTVGTISLSNIVKAMLGRDIDDEADQEEEEKNEPHTSS